MKRCFLLLCTSVLYCTTSLAQGVQNNNQGVIVNVLPAPVYYEPAISNYFPATGSGVAAGEDYVARARTPRAALGTSDQMRTRAETNLIARDDDPSSVLLRLPQGVLLQVMRADHTPTRARVYYKDRNIFGWVRPADLEAVD